MADNKIQVIMDEIRQNLTNKEVAGALLATTFKGLDSTQMAMALREGMVSGFKFEDFLKKDVYAIPYGQSYSLVTSVDFSRKIAMRNGLVGKSAPTYTYKENGDILSCTVTVKRLVEGTVGEYSASVFFEEYYAGHKNQDGSIKKNKYGDVKPNLWDTKKHTMIAKVAEMHALRMAFPEDLSKQYLEEEMREVAYVEVPTGITEDQRKECVLALEEATDAESLGNVWTSFSAKAREDSVVKATMDRLKALYDQPEAVEPKVEDGSVPAEALPEDLK